MTKEQLHNIRDYNTLTRDQLRSNARLHNVRITSQFGTHRTIYDASKDELVRAFTTARDAGHFGAIKSTGTDSPNVRVKTRSVVAFLKGKGCDGRDTWVAATLDDDTLTVYSEFRPEDFEDEDMSSYESFVTTPNDLRALLKALEA